MNSEVALLLQENQNLIKELIDDMKIYHKLKIDIIMTMIDTGLFLSIDEGRITKEEADFIQNEALNCICYLIKDKFDIDLTFVER